MTNRKKPSKVTTGHKITLGALSVFGIAAGWNLIGREASSTANSQQAAAELPTVEAMPVVVTVPTPWPTIAPLPDLPRLALNPVPTLAVSAEQTVANAANPGEQPASVSVSGLPSLAPLPTMAPLPAMPEYVAPPPPPAPAPQVASAPPPPPSGGGNVSKGS